MIRTGQFKYVVHSRIEEYHRAGWMIVSDLANCNHGAYAVLMWRCDCTI
jgi:hypothetical protein